MQAILLGAFPFVALTIFLILFYVFKERFFSELEQEKKQSCTVLPITHPGEVFKARFLERYEITVTAAAKKLHMNHRQLSRFINGHDDVTPLLASKLAIATGVSERYWLERQADYNVQQIQNMKDHKVEAEPLLESFESPVID